MPSSLLFAGLVGTWLAVLVPMAARRRHRMTCPSDAAMASRVLTRPARDGIEEVSGMPGLEDQRPGYRPGRGGYDPEAAELAARARYVFRQRVVLTLVLLAVVSAAVAVGLTVPRAWWVHGGADLVLVVYLVNLRRQVRLEHQIRARRAARMSGRRPAGWPVDDRGVEAPDHQTAEAPEPSASSDQPADATADFQDPPVRHDDWELVPLADVPALSKLPAQRIPPHPAGTERLELDDEDPELYDLDHEELWGYRRAAG